MHIISIEVREKIATHTSKTFYVCGNSDFVVRFDFDAEWDALDVKTARFISENGTYQDQVFTGNECPVPIISNTNDIRVGVFAGNLQTTTPARIQAARSILCPGGVPADPSPDVYNQIMAMLNGLNVDVSPEDIAQAVEDYLAEHPIEGVTPEEVQEEVEKALQAAKESGEFDGRPGVSATHKWDGTVLTMTSASGTSSADLKGDPGYTPQKGEDYWTPEDQQKIISDVLSALPTWTGGAY